MDNEVHSTCIPRRTLAHLPGRNRPHLMQGLLFSFSQNPPRPPCHCETTARNDPLRTGTRPWDWASRRAPVCPDSWVSAGVCVDVAQRNPSTPSGLTTLPNYLVSFDNCLNHTFATNVSRQEPRHYSKRPVRTAAVVCVVAISGSRALVANRPSKTCACIREGRILRGSFLTLQVSIRRQSGIVRCNFQSLLIGWRFGCLACLMTLCVYLRSIPSRWTRGLWP